MKLIHAITLEKLQTLQAFIIINTIITTIILYNWSIPICHLFPTNLNLKCDVSKRYSNVFLKTISVV